VPGIENDPRFDGFRRNWLNILQINPSLKVLSNNSASDTCASCVAAFADICLYSPRLADKYQPLDSLRQLMDAYVDGLPAYGFPATSPSTSPAFPPHQDPIFLDAYPNLLVGATDYVYAATIKSGSKRIIRHSQMGPKLCWRPTATAMDSLNTN